MKLFITDPNPNSWTDTGLTGAIVLMKNNLKKGAMFMILVELSVYFLLNLEKENSI